ncbi:MAG TPA: GMC oxidoreductase [Lysobacter sp.]|nr:GMC oxidoreductase [Lysobacter sp.]
MSNIEDIVIIGAGPAGVSAAWALAERGLRPRLLDAGSAGIGLPPDRDYLDARFHDAGQADWMLGGPARPVAGDGTSPKLRVPGFHAIFGRYAERNAIHGDDGFHVVGALAAGGLSNAWGCGVAAFGADELAPLRLTDMQDAYGRVAQRMGISGASDDPLRPRLGLDAWADAPIELDGLHARLWAHRHALKDPRIAFGRARVAVIGTDRDGRGGCTRRGLCLWGCPRRSTWSALHDLEALRRRDAVRLDTGWHVERLSRDGDAWRIEGSTNHGPSCVRARRVLLATGTLATTRLVLRALGESLGTAPAQVRLQSNPMAAFLAVVPATFGRAPAKAFGLAQLSYEILPPGMRGAFGNLFSTAGLPVSEFLAHLPTTRAAGLPLLRTLLPSCTVGNVFFDGALSSHHVRLASDGSLHVTPGDTVELPAARREVERIVGAALRRLGAWMLPGSFLPGRPGADLHYASTLPMGRDPAAHECHPDGQIAALPGLHVIDAACLPALPAKPHTLTVAANADRIARVVAAAGG